MKFGMQVEGLNAFNLSSDRFKKNQNGCHYDVIIKNHWFCQKYNIVNNAYIHLKFKLEIVHVNTVI